MANRNNHHFLFPWEEENVHRRNTSLDSMNSRPFSWQLPTTPTASSSRTALNEELTFNEQRHFGTRRDSRRDSTSSNAPLLSDWRQPSLRSSYDSPDWRQSSFSSAFESPGTPYNYSRMRSAQPQQPLPTQKSPQYKPDDVLTEQCFLKWYPSGNATLSFHNDENQIESVHDLNLGLIQERSPFLALGFEESRSGPRLYLETVTSTTVWPFLRYLYSGTYALTGPSGDFYEDVPTSLLLHCQLYRLGDIYDLEALKTQAYVNVIRQCEFGCSSPEKPIELCQAIRFVYQHLSTHEKLINTILDYCVACFLRHKLGESEEFTKLAYELRPFHQALCQNSRNRGFEDEAALAIIRMPFEPYIPESYSAREDAFANRFDDVFHFHSDDADSPSKKRKRPEFTLAANRCHYADLPFRPHEEQTTAADEVWAARERDEVFGSKRLYTTRASSPSPFVPAVENHGRLSLRVRNPSPPEDYKSDSDIPLHKVRAATPLEAAENAVLSDTDFEIVDGPAAVEELSDNDSDTESLVEVSNEDAGPAKISNGHAPAARTEDSDSEWEAV